MKRISHSGRSRKRKDVCLAGGGTEACEVPNYLEKYRITFKEPRVLAKSQISLHSAKLFSCKPTDLDKCHSTYSRRHVSLFCDGTLPGVAEVRAGRASDHLTLRTPRDVSPPTEGLEGTGARPEAPAGAS